MCRLGGWLVLLLLSIGSSVGFTSENVEVAKRTNISAKVGRLTKLSGAGINCTATIIGDRYLITAAHCVFNQSTIKPARGILFQPNVIRERKRQFYSNPSYYYSFAEKIFVHKKYIRDVKNFHASQWYETYSDDNQLRKAFEDYDIAIVRLREFSGQESVGKTFGYLPFGAVDFRQTYKTMLMGYPAREKEILLRKSSCQSSSFQDRFFRSLCYSVYGQSGSAMLTKSDRSDSHYIRGVLSGGAATMSDFAPIRKQEFQAIKKILEGNESGQNLFREFILNTGAFNTVQFNNKCSKPIYLVTRTMNEQGDWQNSNWIYIDAKSSSKMYKSYSRKIYYFAQDLHGHKKWQGNARFSVEGDVNRKLRFQTHHAGNRWRYVEHTLTCD